jgi:HEAT repeat protein
MKLQPLKLVMVLLLLFVTEVSNAIPVPILNVPSLVTGSDLIVVGTVVSLRDGGATSITFVGGSVLGRLVLCEVDVDSVLKGTTEGRRISFRYALPNEPIGYSGIALGYQILFLKKANSEYSLASPYHPSLPAVSASGAEEGDELAKIAALLGSVLQSVPAPLGQKQMALYALSTIHTTGSTDLLRRALEQRDPVLRLNAAGFLLLRNDLAGMETAEQALAHPGGLPGNLLHNLDYAIAEGVKSQDAVPMLSRMAHAKELETRRAAASALRHTGAKSALAPLAYLLNDNDLQVRHEAIVGLADITGDLDWGPNLDLFQSQEQQYLKHWRDWASANGLSM